MQKTAGRKHKRAIITIKGPHFKRKNNKSSLQHRGQRNGQEGPGAKESGGARGKVTLCQQGTIISDDDGTKLGEMERQDGDRKAKLKKMLLQPCNSPVLAGGKQRGWSFPE